MRSQGNSRGWLKAGILLLRGDICHPMPLHGYVPEGAGQQGAAGARIALHTELFASLLSCE